MINYKKKMKSNYLIHSCATTVNGISIPTKTVLTENIIPEQNILQMVEKYTWKCNTARHNTVAFMSTRCSQNKLKHSLHRLISKTITQRYFQAPFLKSCPHTTYNPHTCAQTHIQTAPSCLSIRPSRRGQIISHWNETMKCTTKVILRLTRPSF